MDNIIINEQLNFMNFKKLNEQNVTNLFTFIPYNFRKNIVSDNEIKENYNKIQNDINHQFIKISRIGRSAGSWQENQYQQSLMENASS